MNTTNDVHKDVLSMHNDIDKLQQTIDDLRSQIKPKKVEKESIFDRLEANRERIKAARLAKGLPEKPTKKEQWSFFCRCIKKMLMGFGILLIIALIITIYQDPGDDTSTKPATAPTKSIKTSASHTKVGKGKMKLVYVDHPKEDANDPYSFTKAQDYASHKIYDYGDRCMDLIRPSLTDQFERGKLFDFRIRIFPDGAKINSFIVISAVPFHNKFTDSTFMGICKSKMTVDKNGKYKVDYPLHPLNRLIPKGMD